MYAVIFKAQINKLDEEYFKMAKILRESAINQYKCREFISLSEEGQEISISYWNSEDDIKAWKSDIYHLSAQELGQKIWYTSYEVQIVKVIREYCR